MTEQGQPEPPPPSEWQKQWWSEGERAHDRQDAAAGMHMSQLEAFALQGIRTLSLTSAGGIAAVLGFYSANYSRLSTTPYATDKINGLLAMLFISMLATLLCTLFGYFSQVAFTDMVFSRRRTWKHPYVVDTEKTPRLLLLGNICRTLAIIAALFSALCLAIAGYSFLEIAR